LECLGKSDIAAFFRELAHAEKVQVFEPREFISEGDRVVAIIHYRARVKSTGQVGESDLIHVFTIRGGKIVRCFEMFDTAAALRAYQTKEVHA
jgi:uncharacterized protein